MAVGFQNFKLVFKAALFSQSSGISPHTMAGMLDVPLAALYAWTDPDDKRMIPLDKFVKFTRITNDFRPADMLCRMMGGVFVPRK